MINLVSVPDKKIKKRVRLTFKNLLSKKIVLVSKLIRCMVCLELLKIKDKQLKPNLEVIYLSKHT